ncbi:hypothetical protein YN1551_2074 [Sulfolobus islandicus Y.N.15.51]|uniref:FAD linked oxidase domain protein n=1 Tax=Saccharolobus islandicus (strain Y.N.15.51 / Yellowstone \|nr:hypothetical protein YN1551_2074 [Sulfolobus islandicus Y.N.15.51]
MDSFVSIERNSRRGSGKAIRTSMIPDLIRLFIGSEGTLGIISKVKLRVFPLAPFHTDLAFAFDNFNKSINTFLS